MNELKPCPFCGDVYTAGVEGHVKVTETARSGPRYGVACFSCGGRIHFFETETEAIAAWNTRAERTCSLPETRIDHGSIEYNGTTSWRLCSECGEEVLAYPATFCPNCGAKVVD